MWAVAGQWTQCRRSPGSVVAHPAGLAHPAVDPPGVARRPSGRRSAAGCPGVAGAAGRRAAGAAARGSPAWSTTTGRRGGAGQLDDAGGRARPRCAGHHAERARPASPGGRARAPGVERAARRSGPVDGHLERRSAGRRWRRPGWPPTAQRARRTNTPGPTSPTTRKPASSAPSAWTQPDAAVVGHGRPGRHGDHRAGDRARRPAGAGGGTGRPASARRRAVRGPTAAGSRPGGRRGAQHLGHHRRRRRPARRRSPDGGPGWARPWPGRRPGTRSRGRRGGRGPGPSGPG